MVDYVIGKRSKISLVIGVILFMLEGMVDYVIGSYFMFSFF